MNTGSETVEDEEESVFFTQFREESRSRSQSPPPPRPAEMKVAELKAALAERGLDVKGKKAELAARLAAVTANLAVAATPACTFCVFCMFCVFIS
eukprot:COSAG01_NODE_187_length_22645_cov_44.301565_15_plen_95_part_00